LNDGNGMIQNKVSPLDLYKWDNLITLSNWRV
jgi:hypothetical protein